MWGEVEGALRQAATRIVDDVANFLPGALVLIVLLAGALIMAVVFRYAVLRTLRGLEFDRGAHLVGVSALAEWSPARSPSQLIAAGVYWTILLIGLLVGLTAL